MKRYFTAVLLFIMFAFAGIAEARHFSSNQIKTHVNRTPRDVENYISSLSDYLTEPFDEDYDKAKAIAFWIASRINYDEYLYNNGKTSSLRRAYSYQKPEELLKSRVGICGDFALLFSALCREVGIQAGTVIGITYPTYIFVSEAEKENRGHVWNYFWYEGTKIYVDTTFMSEGRTNIFGTISSKNRRNAINEIKKLNEKKSTIRNFDEYYFDFDYQDEEKEREYKREEASLIHLFESLCKSFYILTKITTTIFDSIFKTNISENIKLTSFTDFGRKIDYRILEEVNQFFYIGGFYEYLAKNLATLLSITIKAIENKFNISILDYERTDAIVEFGKNLDIELKLNN